MMVQFGWLRFAAMRAPRENRFAASSSAGGSTLMATVRSVPACHAFQTVLSMPPTPMSSRIR